MLLEKIDAKLEKDAKSPLDDAGRKKGEEDLLTYVFGNRNAAQMALTLAEQDPRLQRGAKVADNAAQLQTAAANVRAGDPNFGVAQFEAALSNLAATIGDLGMADATASLHQLSVTADGAAAALKWLADFNEASKKYMAPLNALVGGPHGDASRLSDVGPDGTVLPVHPGDAPHMPARPYTPTPGIVPPAPVTINSPITAPLNGDLHATVTVNNNLTGLVQTITTEVMAAIRGQMNGLLTGAMNSAASFDGRSHPQSPDASAHILHGGH
jgi:hypothetical protein